MTTPQLLGTTPASGDPVRVNENMNALGQAFIWAHDVTADTGLTVGLAGGNFDETTVADDTLACADDDVNYIVVDRSTLVVSVDTATTDWDDTANFGRVARVTFASGVLTDWADERRSTGGIFDHLGGGTGLSDGDKGDITVSGGGSTWTIDASVISTFGRTLTDDADAATARATLELGTVATLASDTDGTLAANSDSRVATQKAVVSYVNSVVTGGASDVMIFKGVIDCSASPNYPAADAGHLYKVSVAGKIGGASGAVVQVGDTLYCITDSTASGTQAGVGANWVIAQVNIDGAVIGPASATDGHVVLMDGATGKLIKDSGLTLSGSNTGDQTITLTGDVGGSGTGSFAATIANDAVTYAKLQNASATARILARKTAGSGDFEECTVAEVLNFIASSAQGDILIRDATGWTRLGAGTAGQGLKTGGAAANPSWADQPVVVVPFFPGVPTASQLLGVFPAPAGITTLTAAAAIAGSSGKALTAATAQTDIDVRKNATTSAGGSSVGTVRWAAAGTVPTFIAASGFTLTGGTDYLTFWAPASPDATLANFSFALYFTRS